MLTVKEIEEKINNMEEMQQLYPNHKFQQSDFCDVIKAICHQLHILDEQLFNLRDVK